MNTHKVIRQGMRRNELSLLAHLRANNVHSTFFFGRMWHKAMDRLQAGKMVKFNKRTGYYTPVKGGRPVTAAVR